MDDMSQTIVPKSDQMNADDLIAGPRTITIREVKIAPNTEQPVAVYFDGDSGKPFMPGKSMRRAMVFVWGADTAAYSGRSMTLYRDQEVTFGGMKVGGIRISHMSHMGQAMTFVLTATKKTKKPFTVNPLAAVTTRHQQAPVSTAPPRDTRSDAPADAASPEQKARVRAVALLSFIAACADVNALHDIVGDPQINRERDKIKIELPKADQAIAAAIKKRFGELGTAGGAP